MGWQAVNVSMNTASDETKSVMDAKLYKLQPHKLSQVKPHHNVVIWIDSKISSLNMSRVDELLKQSSAGMIMPQNFCCGGLRNDIMDEFRKSMEQQRYDAQSDKIMAFISSMTNLGFDRVSNRFSAGGATIMRIRRPAVRRALDTWYSMTRKTGIYQDQIVWHFVQQMYGSVIEVYTGDWPTALPKIYDLPFSHVDDVDVDASLSERRA